ncbi:MAG: NUDIX domain-containing protein [Lachnospiraceae bacterium]|nr:NUDIX domain-containing protein [Lachnospiraceae bacterium]
MLNYTWHKGEMPEGLPVRQVYGIAFAKDGRIFLRIDNGRYKLTGGRPEGAETFEETLRREYLEEANIELGEARYLGYLEVDDGRERYAQVRMVTQIKKIHENHVDPDTGRMYGRVLVDAGEVKEYLGYSDEAGNQMMDDAVLMAQSYNVFPLEVEVQYNPADPEVCFINGKRGTHIKGK